jgi:hypothetical protein
MATPNEQDFSNADSLRVEQPDSRERCGSAQPFPVYQPSHSETPCRFQTDEQPCPPSDIESQNTYFREMGAWTSENKAVGNRKDTN